jgi:hypothetical protein
LRPKALAGDNPAAIEMHVEPYLVQFFDDVIDVGLLVVYPSISEPEFFFMELLSCFVPLVILPKRAQVMAAPRGAAPCRHRIREAEICKLYKWPLVRFPARVAPRARSQVHSSP